MRTLAPAELAIPRKILTLIPPRPNGYPPHRELFDRRTGVAFDPIAPAEAAAQLTVGMLLLPERAARLVTQHAVDPSLPGLGDVIERLLAATVDAPLPADAYEAEILRAVRTVVVQAIERVSVDAAMPQVRAEARDALARLPARLDRQGPDPADTANRRLLSASIAAVLDGRERPPVLPPEVDVPPGEPIGDCGD